GGGRTGGGPGRAPGDPLRRWAGRLRRRRRAMIARAPGKVVLSGAYAVLEGAPAIVTAVDRYVTADTAKKPSLVTPEVRAALGDARAPGFDASALRKGDQKLGLGSSAAILVASLGAVTAAERGV